METKLSYLKIKIWKIKDWEKTLSWAGENALPLFAAPHFSGTLGGPGESMIVCLQCGREQIKTIKQNKIKNLHLKMLSFTNEGKIKFPKNSWDNVLLPDLSHNKC